MAFVSQVPPEKFPIPHEPGEWMLLVPVRFSDIIGAMEEDVPIKQQVKGMVELVVMLVKEWSYDRPISYESVDDLDTETMTWLFDRFITLNKLDSKKSSQEGDSQAGRAVEQGANVE